MGISQFFRNLREAREAKEAESVQEVERALELEELQKVLAAINRLKPEWQAEGRTIRFSGDTKDGTYEGIMSYEDSYDGSDYLMISGSSGNALINVTLSSRAEVITLFSKRYSDGSYGFGHLKCYVESNQAYREQISRQELERARVMKAEQNKKETEQEAKDRFLGRKTSAASPAELSAPSDTRSNLDREVDSCIDLCTSENANSNLKLLMKRRQGKGKPLTDAEFVKKVRLLAKR